ncbi:unnamed protein product [Calypogeia fissa]
MGMVGKTDIQSVVDDNGNTASVEKSSKRLGELFTGRKAEIDELLSILGEPGDTLPPLLIYGSAATGKTSVVKETMALLKRPFAYVSCRSCHGPRLVFESVLNQLLGHVRCKANNYASAKKCERLSDFVCQLEGACAVACSRNSKEKSSASRCSDGGQEVVYLIFDDVELVRGWTGGGTLLASLVTLSQLTRLPNLGLVFVSSAGPDTFHLGTSARELVPLYFREYTNEELYSILVKWQPNSDLYSFFLKNSLAPFSRASRLLTELSEGLHPLFEKFCEPVLQGNVDPKDQGKRELFNYLKGHTKLALSRTFSIAESEFTGIAASHEAKKGGLKRPREFHLSLCSKYLLLASYIASRNPSKLDDALFGTGDAGKSRKRKRKTSMSAMEKKDADMHEKHLKGPSNCPLERLLAIYKCLAVESDLDSEGTRHSLCPMGEDEEGNINCVTADVLMQLANLTSVDLVLRSSSSPLDGFPRFRSNVDTDFIQKVASSIRFPLSKYLLHG